ncbi:MAG: NAD(P)/FAD-dependent oxidoreductase [Alphaproteobacteria bacterium]
MPQSSTEARHFSTDVAIVGAGPVGLFAVFELGMLKIKAHVIDTLAAPGGQLTALYPEKPIYDIPGFPTVGAQELVKHLEAQAAPFHPTYHLGQQVVKLEKVSPLPNPLPQAGEGTETPRQTPSPVHGRGWGEGPCWKLTTSAGVEIFCKAVLIAAGCGAFGPNRPPLRGIEEYEGTSVHYLVTRREDFRDAEIVIAGGGDSAVDWANSLAELAKKTYVVHRRDKFRAMPESVSRMHALAEAGKIEFVIPYQLEALGGEDGRLHTVAVKNMDGAVREIAAQHLLAFFGLSMELGPIANWGLDLAGSHIAVDAGTLASSEAGIFAIGDIATYPHKLKLILCGFSEAAQAAHSIYKLIYPDVALHFEYSTTKGVPA